MRKVAHTAVFYLLLAIMLVSGLVITEEYFLSRVSALSASACFL